MASTKVVPLHKHLQDSSRLKERAIQSGKEITYLKHGGLEGLVAVAIEHEAFPGAKSLLSLTSHVDTLAQKLEAHDSGRLDESGVVQSIIFALNLREDGVESYRRSLIKIGFQAPGQTHEILSLQELADIHGALESLNAGLSHYIEETKTAPAMKGIAEFRGTFSAILKERLVNKLLTENSEQGPIQ